MRIHAAMGSRIGSSSPSGPAVGHATSQIDAKPLADSHRPADRLAERLAFARAFFRHGVGVASVTPSSRWMAAELSRYVSADRPQRILELGAGTGVVTAAIAQRMHAGSTLTAIEPLRDLWQVARTRVPRADIRLGDAVGVLRDLGDASGHGGFDVVVSGLPFPSLSQAERRRLLALLAKHAPAAVYSQLTEFPLIYMGLYKRCFGSVRFVPVVRNLPPGGVYHCRGVRRSRGSPAA